MFTVKHPPIVAEVIMSGDVWWRLEVETYTNTEISNETPVFVSFEIYLNLICTFIYEMSLKLCTNVPF